MNNSHKNDRKEIIGCMSMLITFAVLIAGIRVIAGYERFTIAISFLFTILQPLIILIAVLILAVLAYMFSNFIITQLINTIEPKPPKKEGKSKDKRQQEAVTTIDGEELLIVDDEYEPFNQAQHINRKN